MESIHTSILLASKREKNLFVDHGDERKLGLSSLAYKFIGGLLQHSRGLCAITNPTTNSYKRLARTPSATGSTWAPSYISYAGNNRTHMIRVPAPGRFEYRLPDGATHPYLFQAAILAAGLSGIKNSIDPGPPQSSNAYGNPDQQHAIVQSLPQSLIEALNLLQKDEEMCKLLGHDLVEAFNRLKREELALAQSNITPWEIDTTLDC